MSFKDDKLSDDDDFDETDGPQENSFERTSSTSSSGQKQSLELAQEYMFKLENAVKSGNVSLASEMAIILAGMRAAIYVKTDATSCKSDLITLVSK